MNRLYYGDNLGVLREHLATGSVDLIYLDPPFNSKRDYNLLFKSPKGATSEAQIQAFKDSWTWDAQAESEYDEVMRQKNTQVAEILRALRQFLGQNDMMAYLTMMANRLLELHRVLKPTGSLYLHCDPTASHYLKIVLDGIFGKENFRNEIIWKRTNAHNFKTKGYARAHDTIFYYTKTGDFVFNEQYTEYSGAQLGRYKPDKDGRLYKAENMTFSTSNPLRQFEWRGVRPPKNRSWGYDLETLERLWREGRILTKKDGTPRMDGLKIYLDETKGMPLSTNWTDIDRIGNTSAERLGYPTQKPLALLERIISVSSNKGDVVLDPFCGCGTAVHAAQKLGRKWIGIDITCLAVSLIEKRLKDAFRGIKFEIIGTPRDFESARDLARRDKYQFQWWAVSLVGAQPSQGKKKGADGGVDGVKYFRDVDTKGTRKLVVSVKGGESLKADDVRSLMAVRDREGADIAALISLAEQTPGMRADAASTGFHNGASGKKYQRVQLLSIGGLLAGRERLEHPDYEPNLNYKQAGEENPESQMVMEV